MTQLERDRIISLMNNSNRTTEEYYELVSLHNKFIDTPRATNSLCGGCIQRMITRLRTYLENN